jgi:hypothetical protein
MVFVDIEPHTLNAEDERPLAFLPFCRVHLERGVVSRCSGKWSASQGSM